MAPVRRRTVSVRFLLPLSLLLLPAFVLADTVDDVVAREMQRAKIPGLSLGIMRNGKLIRKQAYGLADIELQAPAGENDLYEIGSMTKQFTAFLTLMLVEEGKVGLDDPVSKYVPEAPESWKEITVRNLLNQNSGIPEYALLAGTRLTDSFTREQWMKNITVLPLDFPAATTWAYSNSNFALLGWIIEKAGGKDYTEQLTERVLAPLGMTSTRFEDLNEVIPRRSHGYYPQPDGALIKLQGAANAIQSDGTLMSNVEDLAKWDAALRDRKLLKPESYSLLWSPGKLKDGRTRPYGMGWFLAAPGSAPVVYHMGASVGYGGCITRYRDGDLSVVVLTNLYGGAPELIARKVAEAIDPTVAPEKPSPMADPKPERTQDVKSVLERLGSGVADPAVMEQELIAPLKTGRAQAFPQYRDLAKIEALDFAGEAKRGGDTMITYRLKNAQRTLTAYVVWSPEGKLAQLFLRPDSV